MEELSNIKASVSPSEILLVVDAMTGQDAVNVSQSFNEQLGIDGVILTKMDGDARGGAALSVRHVTESRLNMSVWVKSSATWSRFIPTVWRRGFWVWATC